MTDATEASTDTQEAGAEAAKKETKRARVRRLFIEPMQDAGFRKPHKISADVFREKLDRLTDYLTYMSDDGLRVLLEMCLRQGQGRNHDQWPPRATIYKICEYIEPCPIDRIPSLVSWFRSRAGAEADREGTLVETFDYIRMRKKPPVEPGARLAIQQKAESNRRELELVRERIERGTASEEELAFRRGYEARLAYVQAIMRNGAPPAPFPETVTGVNGRMA